MQWRNQGFHIFDIESRFRGDAILCEKFIERRPEELAIDEEFQRDRFLGFQQPVDQCGELVTFEIWEICQNI